MGSLLAPLSKKGHLSISRCGKRHPHKTTDCFGVYRDNDVIISSRQLLLLCIVPMSYIYYLNESRPCSARSSIELEHTVEMTDYSSALSIYYKLLATVAIKLVFSSSR